MNIRKGLAVVATALFLTVSVYAADVTGTWNAKVDLGGQGGSPTFVLKQDGEKITGTYQGAFGEAPLTGTLKGSEITLNFSVQDTAIKYTGKVSADGTKMEGTCDYGGQASGTFTATKGEPAKNKK